MFVTAPFADGKPPFVSLFQSADGINFRNLGLEGYPGDRSTMHYDALLRKWVYSLRDAREGVRCRSFILADEPVPGAAPFYTSWNRDKAPEKSSFVMAEAWTELDRDYGGANCQLYNLDAVPYESLMLGVMEVLHNTPHDNQDSEEAGLPKQTALRFAFSRDGRNYTPAPRIRFMLHCATLYSFWISPSARGESRGFVAAGGPDYPRGLKDL